jgi:hypothetical protein
MRVTVGGKCHPPISVEAGSDDRPTGISPGTCDQAPTSIQPIYSADTLSLSHYI